MDAFKKCIAVAIDKTYFVWSQCKSVFLSFQADAESCKMLW